MGTLHITYNDVLTLLSIIAVALLIVILYHLIFVSRSLRRTAERVDQLSEDIESLILKPIGTIDYMIDWFIAMVENVKGGEKKHKKGK
jgi:cell division protein FtsB